MDDGRRAAADGRRRGQYCQSLDALPVPLRTPSSFRPSVRRCARTRSPAPSEVQSLRSKKGFCRRYGAGANTLRSSCPTRTATTRSNWRWRGTGANCRACSGLKPPSGPGTPGAASSPRDPTPIPMLAAGSRRIPVRSHACRALHGSVCSVTTPRSLTCTLRAAANCQPCRFTTMMPCNHSGDGADGCFYALLSRVPQFGVRQAPQPTRTH